MQKMVFLMELEVLDGKDTSSQLRLHRHFDTVKFDRHDSQNESHIESELPIKVLTTNLPTLGTRHHFDQGKCDLVPVPSNLLCQGPMGTGQGKTDREP